MKPFVSYRRSGFGRNGRVRSGLDRVVAEAAASEVARRRRAAAAPRDDPLRPLLLGLQRREGRVESLSGDSVPFEIKADRGVTPTPFR